MVPWAPPFKVACRICYQIEGKLKNYKNDKFYIKAYECLTGYQFEEVPYLNYFCPSCACVLKKLFRFKKQCRSAHYWLMDYLNSGRKVSQPYIRQMQEYRLKNRPVQLKIWRSDKQTVVDCVHATKRYKPKPKVVYDIGVAHLSVPKNPEQDTWHFRATPKVPFWSDSSCPSVEEEFDDEERMEMAKGYMHAERYNLPYEDRIGTLNIKNMPVELGSHPVIRSQPIQQLAQKTTVGANSPASKGNSGHIGTQPQPASNSDIQFTVERRGGEISRASLGSNPAIPSQSVQPIAGNMTDSELGAVGANSPASKGNSGYIDYQPQPSTSNSILRPIYERNQNVQPTCTPLPLTKENVQKLNAQAILKPLEELYRYQCRFCFLRFTEQDSLNAHIIKFHQGPSHQTPQPPQAINTALMYRNPSTSHK